jgi:chemotaxis protein histidine kinase CheA
MAQSELSESIKFLDEIMINCKSDSDIISNHKEMGRYLHNVKGLAPMIGFEKIAKLANLTETILNDIIKNNLKISSYDFVNESIKTMKLILEEDVSNLEQLEKKNITQPQILELFK